MARHELPVACDLADGSLRWAIERLTTLTSVSPVALVVHPYSKHLALRIVYEAGWRVEIQVDPTFDEDEWLIRGEGGDEIHSEGG